MSPSVYTTLQGDTLEALAKRHNLTWRSIFHARDNERLRELLRSPNVALPRDTQIWLTGGVPGGSVKTGPNQTLAEVCSANGGLSWAEVFENPSNGSVRFLCVDPNMALAAGLTIQLPAPGEADAGTAGQPCAPGQLNAYTLSDAGEVRVAAGTKAGAGAKETGSPSSPPASGDEEVPKDIQEQWRAATEKIAGRLGEMGKSVDGASMPPEKKAAIRGFLTSLGRMLSDPLETVDEARVVLAYLEDNLSFIDSIESSSLIEPKIEILSALGPILAKIKGVAPDEGDSAPDDGASDDAPTSPDASDDAPTSPDASPAPEAGDEEVPKDIQEQWRAAAQKIAGRLGEMGKSVDGASMPPEKKAAIRGFLTSLGGMLSDPLETVDEARVVLAYLEDNISFIDSIESSSLIEPKIEILSALGPILAMIPGVAPAAAPDADAGEQDPPVDD